MPRIHALPRLQDLQLAKRLSNKPGPVTKQLALVPAGGAGIRLCSLRNYFIAVAPSTAARGRSRGKKQKEMAKTAAKDDDGDVTLVGDYCGYVSLCGN
jgi:hypothetical protein